jgi:hypothetical protein
MSSSVAIESNSISNNDTSDSNQDSLVSDSTVDSIESANNFADVSHNTYTKRGNKRLPILIVSIVVVLIAIGTVYTLFNSRTNENDETSSELNEDVDGTYSTNTNTDEKGLYYSKELLDAVNEEREKNGLDPLKWSGKLAEGSLTYAADMPAQSDDQFNSFIRPSGQAWYTAFIYLEDPESSVQLYCVRGSNVKDDSYFIYGFEKKAWLEAFLNENYKSMGAAYCYDANSEYGYYWAIAFME